MEVIFQKTQFWQHHKNTDLSERQIMALNKIFKSGKATATRDLGDLVSKDCLSVKGIGSGVRYFIK
jgi:hypothetical protein